jgi:hypothetical protein
MNQVKEPLVLVLTATIIPRSGVEGVQRSDPRQRMSDYIETLDYYLSLPDHVVDRVVFLENSGYDLSELERHALQSSGGKRLEFLSLPANPALPPTKIHGELQMLEDGLRLSSLIKEDDIFMKITGRLRLLNLDDFIKLNWQEYDLVCDLHNIPFAGHGAVINKYMDLRLFFCRASTFADLFRGLASAHTSSLNSSLLYKIVLRNRGTFGIKPRFPVEPLLAGIGARHNLDYSEGLPRIKRNFRAAIRKTLPNIWL